MIVIAHLPAKRMLWVAVHGPERNGIVLVDTIDCGFSGDCCGVLVNYRRAQFTIIIIVWSKP
ncbi:hypothetical protein FHT71_001741 [Rhizobium sp. BK060]|nr:hypothetical protein [Rhizobium sp. BK060]